MSRIIGCRDLHIAKLVKDETGTDKPTYSSITRVPSLINISISDSVESSNFYSDDTIEQSFSKTSKKDVDIELGYLTNELEALINGRTVDENGVLVQCGDDAPIEVALMFRAPKSKGGAFRYVCLYKGTLAKTDSEYKTQEDSVESSNIKLTGTFIPLQCNNKMSAIADSDDSLTSTAVAAWFTSVYGAEMEE